MANESKYKRRKARKQAQIHKHYVMSDQAIIALVAVQETVGLPSESATVRFCATKMQELLTAAPGGMVSVRTEGGERIISLRSGPT